MKVNETITKKEERKKTPSEVLKGSMESTNAFDMLPNEVFQLIFAAVADCKALVRCMAVSKLFKAQSSRVTSLSITCPGQFASYEEKLQGIHAMVKEFHLLEALVVRVGHPKDDPPSWAQCMRYAEVGASVEKFVFMAAKSGDFSEFDSALGGGQEFHEHGRGNPHFGTVRAKFNNGFPDNQTQNVHTSRISNNRGNESITFQRCCYLNYGHSQI